MNMKELLNNLDELKNITAEELLQLKAAIDAELKRRRTEEDDLVVYQHDCFGCSTYHHRKYKHWAKLVSAVDKKQTSGYAFSGEFLSVDRQSKIPAGSIVVEVCGNTIKAYRITPHGKEKLAEARTNAMVELIDKVAAALHQ